jgi:hypothetical protein
MTEQDPAMERARKRARELKDFYGHLVTYVLVCSLLVVIDLADSSEADEFIGLSWAYWPILGWGIAIVIHAVSVLRPSSSIRGNNVATWVSTRPGQRLPRRQRDR